MQEAFGPYLGDEFMWVLEGQVSMVDGDGNETLINQGETFCIRNAIPIIWKQEGFLRKFFMIYVNPDEPAPDISSADGGVMILDTAILDHGLAKINTTEPFVIEDSKPVQRDNILFTNDA